MDFMRLLKSIEELLYEVVTWLLFYPLTVAKIVRRPVSMMAYAERELTDDVDEQYADTLSPPICLLITLSLILVLGRIGTSETALPGIFSNDNNLLAFRAVAFSIFPLLLGLVSLRQQGTKLTRQSLRPGFYAQCYVAIPFVVAFTVGAMIAERGAPIAGLVLLAAGYVWYAIVQTLWQSRGGRIRRVVALITSVLAILAGTIAFLAMIVVAAFAIGLVSAAGA